MCVLSEAATPKEIAGRMAVQCMTQRRGANNPKWQKKVVNIFNNFIISAQFRLISVHRSFSNTALQVAHSLLPHYHLE